jgi:KipI family sensor histidine kinase inhibitor
VQIRPASDHSLLISLDSQEEVWRLAGPLRDILAVRNVHPAYATILVAFDPLRTDLPQLEQAIQDLHASASSAPLPTPRTIEIPVDYGGGSGPDLADVAALHRLTPEQVIAIHSEPTYRVSFLGFSPGFPYLEGMPPAIATPRLDSPRKHVPAGSVAIGGSHTGIYPMASPGGWRIIGRTPLRLFEPERTPPTLLEMGDLVKFVPA